MINVKIINKNNSKPISLHPKDIDPFKTQMYEIFYQELSTGTYLFTDGGQVMYFYDDDGLRLGYQTTKDLKEFTAPTRAVPINAKISITIEVE
jgi:hypothetical protein